MSYREITKDSRHKKHQCAEQQANVNIKRDKRFVEDDVVQFKLSESHHYDVQEQSVTKLKHRLDTRTQTHTSAIQPTTVYSTTYLQDSTGGAVA